MTEKKIKTLYSKTQQIDVSNIFDNIPNDAKHIQTGGSNIKKSSVTKKTLKTKSDKQKKIKHDSDYDESDNFDSDDVSLNDSDSQHGNGIDDDFVDDKEELEEEEEEVANEKHKKKKKNNKNNNSKDIDQNEDIEEKNEDEDVDDEDVDDDVDDEDDEDDENEDEDEDKEDDKDTLDTTNKCYSKYAKDKGDLDLDEYLKDDDIVITKKGRVGKPILFKYEKVRLLSDRSRQLAEGAKPMIKDTVGLSHKEIALIELKNKLIPLIIERPIPNSGFERWKLSELEIPDYD
jgi:DNA-directed RNA polymerase subunit K/omega